MEYQPKGGITMETEERGLEIIDEGMEECDMVCSCCAAGATSARK
jgi:hypothetical protein